MKYYYELFLNKKYIEEKEWKNIINIISNYNGLFKRWKLIIINKNNQLRFLIITSCSLPSIINNIESIVLKSISKIKIKKTRINLILPPIINKNIVDIINYYNIKNKGKVKYIEMNFTKIFRNRIISNINIYLHKNKTKKYMSFNKYPEKILSSDFSINKNFFYKETPKYLEINKIVNLLNTDLNNSILNIDVFPYLQGNFYLNQNNYSFDKHSIILGSSGCGKSKFISLLIDNINRMNNLKNKYKVVVIDPHASLEYDIGGMGQVVDFTTEEDSINLFMNDSEDIISSTELLLDMFKTLISDQYNSKVERILRHSLYLLLSINSLNFKNLKKLILDLEYRNSLINQVKDEMSNTIIDFFTTDFNELKTKSYSEAISPIISFIDEMEIIPIFNSNNNIEDISSIVEKNFLTLFSLDRTKLGDRVTKTISGLIMQQLLLLVQKKKINEHIIFIIDEVSVIENPILSRILSESRKYNLSLVIAGQYFNQISKDLQNSIFANVINYYIFRVSKMDANLIVDNLDIKVPLDDTRERKIKLLTEQNNRNCIVRIEANNILLPAFKAKTIDFISKPRKKINKKIVQESVNKKIDQHFDFKIEEDINMKEILKTNSSSRKVVNI